MSIIQEPDAQQKRLEILRFRVISSFLSELPHSTTIQVEDNLVDLKPRQRETIKVCNALAQALVMRHEVVAVAASHRYEEGAKGTLYVAAVSSEDSEMAQFAQTSRPATTFSWKDSALAKVKGAIHFLCSVNPPKAIDNLKSEGVRLPQCLAAEALPGVTRANVLDHMLSLQNNW